MSSLVSSVELGRGLSSSLVREFLVSGSSAGCRVPMLPLLPVASTILQSEGRLC